LEGGTWEVSEKENPESLRKEKIEKKKERGNLS